MTIQTLANELDIILSDGTLITINEKYGLIWFHPDGHLKEGSFRLNLKLKMVDVKAGHSNSRKMPMWKNQRNHHPEMEK